MTRRLLVLGLLAVLVGCEDLPPEVPVPSVEVSPSVVTETLVATLEIPSPSPSPVRPSVAPTVRPTLTPRPTPTPSASPGPTSEIVLSGNLDARVPLEAPETPEGPLNYVDVPGTVHDSGAVPHCAIVRFTHTESATWVWQIFVLDATSITPNAGEAPLAIAFAGAGQRRSGAYDLVWMLPSGDMTTATIRLDLAGVSQQAVPTSVKWSRQDGAGAPLVCE